MFTRHRTDQTLGEREILGDEERADLLHTIADLVATVAELRSRVDAQFTTIAAHAEIARQHSDLVSREARSDLDRSRETLIGLIQQVRTELVENTRTAHGPTDDSARTNEQRLAALEACVAELAEMFERGRVRHDRLADTTAAMTGTAIDTVMSDSTAAMTGTAIDTVMSDSTDSMITDLGDQPVPGLALA